MTGQFSYNKKIIYFMASHGLKGLEPHEAQ